MWRVDAVKAGEVSLRWRREGHQPAHPVFRRQREGDAALGRVLGELVVELSQTTLGDGPPGTIPAQALQPLSVIAVHGRVSVQRKPFGDGDPLPPMARQWYLKRQSRLNGLLLEPLEVTASG